MSNSPSFDQVIAALGLDADREAWRKYWPAEPIPGVAELTLFTSDAPLAEALASLDEMLAWLILPQEAKPAIREALVSLYSSVHARALLRQCVRMLSLDYACAPQMPRLRTELGAWAPLFQALAVIGCIPVTQQRHRLRGVPDAITRATFNDISRRLIDYRQLHGRWGFSYAFWLSFHISGGLIELGRLQYYRKEFDLPFRVYRDKQGGPPVTLIADGQRIGFNGQYLLADKGIDRDGPHFVTSFSSSATEVTAHRVTPEDAIESALSTLSLDRYRCVVEPGTRVLDVHIPAGEPLDADACRESFALAADFFPRHYPDHPFPAFMCVSWLMDPQLGRSLPPASNIVRFLGMFQSLPVVSGNDNQTFERVFGGPVADLKSAPRTTSLQRAILDHALTGGRWRHAGAVKLWP